MTESPPHPLGAFSRKYAPPLAVLCTAALILMWNNAGPTAVLVAGHQFVEGQAEVQAGPLRVDVNGRASIRVIPAGPALSPSDVAQFSRYGLPEELNESTVEVTVHRGTATVSGPGVPKDSLGPGESKEFPPLPR